MSLQAFDVQHHERAALQRIERQRIVELAGELIAAGGENPGGTEQGTVAVLAAALERLGARVSLDAVAPQRPNLVAHLGGDATGGGLLFLGHSDVVPAGAGWHGDPFTSRVDGDRLTGRGASDMKGGLAAVVVAMAAVNAVAPQIPLTLVCTVDEEADALGVGHYVATAPAGGYTGCVVAEPTDLVGIIGCRGAANLRLRITGASAHAGRPSDGASAIQAAAEVISWLRADAARLADTGHPVLGAATWNVGTLHAGHGTSIVPDTAELGVDRRLLPGQDPQQILEQLLRRLRLLIADSAIPHRELIQITGEVQMQMPGFLTEPGHPFTRRVCQALADAGASAETGIWTASCEGGFLAEHHQVPTLVLGPGEINTQAHQPNESVSIQDLCTAARAYALIALRHHHHQWD